MMTPKEQATMQQALEALIVAEEFVNRHSEDWYISGQQDLKHIREAITSLREALAEQAEQEPIYISESCAERGCACHYSVEVDGEPVAVYSDPVRTKDLTDDDIQKLRYKLDLTAEWSYVNFARAVIAADREKNRG